MRVEFHLEDLANKKATLSETFVRTVAAPYEMNWRLSCNHDVKKVGVLVSREDPPC